MQTCKQCEHAIDDTNNGEAWGRPDLCWECAETLAKVRGCSHEYEWCNCAASPAPSTTEELTDFLRENLAVVVDVEEADTDGWYNSNDKIRITVNLTLHGEVISHDTAAIRKL
jgi:hypothetical protein